MKMLPLLLLCTRREPRRKHKHVKNFFCLNLMLTFYTPTFIVYVSYSSESNIFIFGVTTTRTVDSSVAAARWRQCRRRCPISQQISEEMRDLRRGSSAEGRGGHHVIETKWNRMGQAGRRSRLAVWRTSTLVRALSQPRAVFSSSAQRARY